jgi:RimJ/RimL family protein N-acetyltransferase
MTTSQADESSMVYLKLIPEAALEALLAGSLAEASEIVGLDLPKFYLTQGRHWRFRLEQIRADPAVAPWLARAVYGRPAEAVVGRAGFHGPPNDRGMVEIGYSTVPEYRRRGYARAAVGQLIGYAAQHGARVVRASVRPDNVGSLAVIRAYGFRHVGEQWDEEDGRELVLERPADHGITGNW